MKKILQSYARQAKLIFALNDGAIKNLEEVGTERSKIKKMLYGIWGVQTDVFKPMPQLKQKKIIIIS